MTLAQKKAAAAKKKTAAAKKAAAKKTKASKDSIVPQVLINANKNVALFLTGETKSSFKAFLQIMLGGAIFQGTVIGLPKLWNMGKSLINRNDEDNVVDLKRVS